MDKRKAKRSLTLDFEYQHSFFNIYTVCISEIILDLLKKSWETANMT